MELNNHHIFHQLRVQIRPFTLVAPPHSRQSHQDIILRHLQGFRLHPHLPRLRCQEITVMHLNMADHSIVLVTVKGKL